MSAVNSLTLRRSSAALILALLVIGPAAAASAGSLDRSFGSHGFVEAPGTAEWIGERPAAGNRAANYPGGRLVVGGHDRHGFAVYRFRADGRLDSRFGEGGIARVTLPGEGGAGSFGSVSAVAVQPDGRILVAGLFTPYPVDNCEECEPEYGDPREYSAVARLNPDGGLDTSFGGSRRGHKNEGLVLLHDKSINEITVHSGKIFIAGEAVEGGGEFGEAGYVGRLDLSGRFSSGWGRRGLVLVPPSRSVAAGDSSVGGIAFDAAGRIYAGGYDHGRFMLARLTRRGGLDRQFGRQGIVRTGVGGNCACAWASGIARDGHGRLLLSGSVGKGGDSAIAIARYQSGGRLDPSFGQGGIVRTRIGHAAYGDGVAVMPDGDIAVAGATAHRHHFVAKFAVVRYRPDGRRDHAFSGDGVFQARFVKGGDRAMQPLVDAAGRLVVAGETVIARFLNTARRKG